MLHRLGSIKGADDGLHALRRDVRVDSLGGSSMYGGMSLPDTHENNKQFDSSKYLLDPAVKVETEATPLFRQAAAPGAGIKLT